jgi:murein DD-endopeptidase MepM/ murein hydrolase activator NlpD
MACARNNHTAAAFIFVLGGLALACGTAAQDAPPVLELPLRCKVGTDCFIQQYFDHDPGPGAKDYRCGVKVYDGHDGTDFRLPTQAAQRDGVAVLAAADGVVQGVRDGMADADVRIAGAGSVKGRECGNGVLLMHRGGWQTQYCHMANGSVRVRNGQSVAAGTELGLVGESGDAAFPHLHLSVRHGPEKIDPFGFGAQRCGEGRSLWSARAREQLAYHAPELINAGFADGPVSMADIEAGISASRQATVQGAGLAAYVRAIGLAAGDVQALSVTAPDGTLFAQSSPAPLDANKAEWFMLTGRKRKADGFRPGRYTARYLVRRDGETVLDRSFTLDVR